MIDTATTSYWKLLLTIGGTGGPQPSTSNDRFMFAFGGNGYLHPFLACDDTLDRAKGSLMDLKAPRDTKVIRETARRAVQSDDPVDAGNLLGDIHIVVAIFEYMNDPQFVERFNEVLEQVWTQLHYIELATGVGGLTGWWYNFVEDYLNQIEESAQHWYSEAIAAAVLPYQQAQASGRNLTTYQQVVHVLTAWDLLEDQFKFPDRYWKDDNDDNDD